MSDVERVDLPSGETVFYREAQHSYWSGFDEATGKCSGRLVGVTTVAKALDTNADPLITWGAKLEAQGVCELLSAASDSDREHLLSNGGDRLHAELVAAGLDWRSVRDRRASQGSNVHERIFAALGRGETPSLASLKDEERGYGQAAFRFWRDAKPDPIAVEQVVYLPEYGVAGRFDLLARIDGEVVLVDAKTSKAAYLSHHVQLAGYRIGCEDSGFEAPERCLVLLLRPDGSYETVEGCGTIEDWEAAHTAYTATKRVGKAQRALAKAVAA
jgi:hypothetical protein